MNQQSTSGKSSRKKTLWILLWILVPLVLIFIVYIYSQALNFPVKRHDRVRIQRAAKDYEVVIQFVPGDATVNESICVRSDGDDPIKTIAVFPKYNDVVGYEIYDDSMMQLILTHTHHYPHPRPDTFHINLNSDKKEIYYKQ